MSSHNYRTKTRRSLSNSVYTNLRRFCGRSITLRWRTTVAFFTITSSQNAKYTCNALCAGHIRITIRFACINWGNTATSTTRVHCVINAVNSIALCNVYPCNSSERKMINVAVSMCTTIHPTAHRMTTSRQVCTRRNIYIVECLNGNITNIYFKKSIRL